jgi:hopene-associated glycosyltransferase HpnB
MEALLIFVVALSTLSWIGFALLPLGLWRNREVLEVIDAAEGDEPLAEVTAVIPARNEAAIIQRTLLSVATQGPDLKIILIDDGSEDSTAEMARRLARSNLRIVQSAPLPDGWSGKLWALEQGRQQVTTRYTLFLDADIKLTRGIIKALKDKMRHQAAQFISLMAVPSMASGWEKLLMPAFIYFFNALYPFRGVNSPNSNMAAAAAGGCILVETRVLEQIGGFESIKSAVIDDCAFARRVKLQGFKIWLGLTHSVESIRGYKKLKEIGDMVARSAFAQLHYSLGLLMLCTIVMLLLYALPAFTVASSNGVMRYLSLASLGIMLLTYLPTLRFYRRSWAWALCLPLIATFFLAMTWTSAIRYWRGERTRWKGRVYKRAVGLTSAGKQFR